MAARVAKRMPSWESKWQPLHGTRGMVRKRAKKGQRQTAQKVRERAKKFKDSRKQRNSRKTIRVLVVDRLILGTRGAKGRPRVFYTIRTLFCTSATLFFAPGSLPIFGPSPRFLSLQLMSHALTSKSCHATVTTTTAKSLHKRHVLPNLLRDGTVKAHKHFQHKLSGPHPKPPILGHPIIFPSFPGKERKKRDPHKLFSTGILGVKSGVPNEPFSAT